jgi:hypothetical protein
VTVLPAYDALLVCRLLLAREEEIRVKTARYVIILYGGPIVIGILVVCAVISYFVGLQWAENDHRFIVWLFASGLILGLLVLTAPRPWKRTRTVDLQSNPFAPDYRPIEIILLLLGAGLCTLSILFMKDVGWFWQLILACALVIGVFPFTALIVLRRTRVEPLE